MRAAPARIRFPKPAPHHHQRAAALQRKDTKWRGRARAAAFRVPAKSELPGAGTKRTDRAPAAKTGARFAYRKTKREASREVVRLKPLNGATPRSPRA
jgi:hypothetical protein